VIDSSSALGCPDELDWCGREVRVGVVRLRIVMPMMRCAMTIHAQADLPKDPRIMRTLVRELDMNFGVGVEVMEPGSVALGDQVVLVEQG
jgi:hypothetical protein